MAKSKKINPRRKPATMADVNRAKVRASDTATKITLAIFLTVLCDDFDFTKEQITHAWERLDKLSEEVAERRVSAHDLITVLRDEYGVDLS